ncbi:MAG TPA: hypothetical protein VK021_01705 [Flavobacteriaceae bacterium]|nr:hypothetical protein [Flavobacteriaceae bacterium]
MKVKLDYRRYLQKFLIGLLCCLISNIVYGQRKFEYGPIPKDGVKLIYQKFDVDDVVPGSSGQNVTWDFSTIGKRQSRVVRNYMPSDSLALAEFPGANFMEIIGDSIFRALKTEFGRTYSLGYFDKPANLKISYPKPLLLSRFPVSYRDVVFRNYTTIFSMGEEEFRGEGRVKIEADGYGRLRLPDTIYNNVMRLRISKKQTDEIEEYEVTQNSSTVTYMWLTETHRYPVFILTKSTSENKTYKEGLLLKKVVERDFKYYFQRTMD